MSFYKLRSDGYTREVISTLIPVIFVTTGVSITAYFLLGYNYSGKALIVIPIVLLFVSSYNYNRLKSQWNSFLIAVDGGVIARQVIGLPEVYIRKGDIKKVIEDPSRGLLLQLGGRSKVYIPSSLENYENMKDMLLQWSLDKNIAFGKIFITEWLLYLQLK